MIYYYHIRASVGRPRDTLVTLGYQCGQNEIQYCHQGRNTVLTLTLVFVDTSGATKGTDLENVESIKYLGVTITSDLRFEMEYTCKQYLL